MEFKYGQIQTLWDAEAPIRRKENMIRILGRTTNIPKRFVGYDFKIRRGDPEKVLADAGYVKKEGYGYVRKIESGGQYHIYFLKEPRMVNIHRDKLMNKKHMATTEGVADEIKRIRKLMPKDLTFSALKYK